MTTRKQFRFLDEDLRLLNELKEKLGYDKDIEVIRYLLRGIPAKAEVVSPVKNRIPEKGQAPFDMCPKHKGYNKSCGGPH